ncbi:transglutaminaseTgpA domain-containing protein [Agromyces sp. H3Y2-19a]|uniref:transglutaminase family protein n=1 Tax=Agromyces chromiiresistens TaxID=3030835 RepID=UPI0023B9F702|nr:transglutaminase domain-containing protein [Agromyces chromiiresistens]MDF0515019.1 transglutaminaseTgpA domain-containing protein [Agromyces chromiiresistens]
MRRLPRNVVSDLLVLSLLSLLGIVGYETSFGDLNFLVAAIAGLVVGTLAAVAGAVWRLGVLTTVLVAVAAYFILGTPFTMPETGLFAVLPSLTSLAGLAYGAVFGWADIVTIGTPVEAPYYIAALPYFAAWLVSLVGTMLATRWLPKRRTALRASVLVIGPALLYLSGILLGTDEPYFAGVRGVAFAVIALVWIAWHRGTTVEATGEGAKRLRRQKITGTSAVVAGAVAIGAIAGVAFAPVSPERFVLRDEVVPPFDPLEFPSPLSGFRKYTKDLAEETLFTVRGLQPGDTLRLATMDSYTGRLWNVAGPEDAGSDAGYGIVGESLPEPGLADLGSKRDVEIEVGAYSDVWLPTVGYGSSLHLQDAASAARASDLRYNPDAGTAVLTSGIGEGTRYELTANVQREPDTDDMLDVPVADLTLPIVENSPDVAEAKASELAGDAASPIEQLRAIEKALKTNGFLSHGLASDEVASRAGHGADRITELFTRSQMVGDAEQYAAAMALMARDLGYPARVVMGFAPDVAEGQDEVEVVGDDVTAWVEVAFDGIGWVSFHPTPDQVDVPKEETPKPKSEPQPQVRQPPRAEQTEDELLATVEIDDTDDDDKDRPFQIPGWVWIALGSIAIPAALVFLPMLAAALIKAARRRRRRSGPNDRQAAAAWDELVDRYAELGFEPPTRATRLQSARALEQQVVEQGLGDAMQGADAAAEGVPLSTLASTIDRDVFDGRPVSDEVVARRWTEAEAATAAVTAAVGRARRFISRYRIRRRR